MFIAIIVAADEKGTIGADGNLPWRLSADLKRFRRLTEGSTVVMGRKTYDSIGKPLPKRHNVVLTRNPDFLAEGVEVVHSIDEFLAQLGTESMVFVIGGAEVYKEFLCVADTVYLTRVRCQVDGDTKFEFLPDEGWELVEQIDYPADDANEYPYSFMTYERRCNYGQQQKEEE